MGLDDKLESLDELGEKLDEGVGLGEKGGEVWEELERLAIERGRRAIGEVAYLGLQDSDRKYKKKARPDKELISKHRIEVNGERWFTYRQLCSILMCVPATLYNYVRSGDVESLEIEGMTLYRESRLTPKKREAVKVRHEREQRKLRGEKRKVRINKKGKKEVYYGQEEGDSGREEGDRGQEWGDE